MRNAVKEPTLTASVAAEPAGEDYLAMFARQFAKARQDSEEACDKLDRSIRAQQEAQNAFAEAQNALILARQDLLEYAGRSGN